MGIVAVYVIYLLISALLTIVTAVVLGRSGKTFLTHVFGGDAALGRAVATLFVVGSCLLNLGFVVLAMRTTANVQDTRQAVELLSVKLGEVLLITGLLHLLNVLVLTSIKRRGEASPDLWRPAKPRPRVLWMAVQWLSWRWTTGPRRNSRAGPRASRPGRRSWRQRCGCSARTATRRPPCVRSPRRPAWPPGTPITTTAPRKS